MMRVWSAAPSDWIRAAAAASSARRQLVLGDCPFLLHGECPPGEGGLVGLLLDGFSSRRLERLLDRGVGLDAAHANRHDGQAHGRQISVAGKARADSVPQSIDAAGQQLGQSGPAHDAPDVLLGKLRQTIGDLLKRVLGV
jgi:hypothetical protein